MTTKHNSKVRQLYQQKNDKLLYQNESVLFLEPACIDFSKVHNTKFISSLEMLIKDSKDEKVQDIIGSSASAIIALLLGLGYSFTEIVNTLNDIYFYKLLNSNVYHTPLLVVVNSKTQNSNVALIETQVRCLQDDDFLIWAKQQVLAKLGSPWATFSDLHKQVQKNSTFKDLHFIGINLNVGELVLLNNKNTPEMPIAIAVRICMSCLTTFPPVEIRDLSTNKGTAYIDGGIAFQHINFDGSYIMFQ